MDIYYKGFVISYGNYDYATYRLFDSMGEGVIFFIKGKEDYIKFCNKYHEKTIFDFGLNLTDEQMKKVEEKNQWAYQEFISMAISKRFLQKFK